MFNPYDDAIAQRIAFKEDETAPTKDDILLLIDEALDKKNEEEFMRLTSILKTL